MHKKFEFKQELWARSLIEISRAIERKLNWRSWRLGAPRPKSVEKKNNVKREFFDFPRAQCNLQSWWKYHAKLPGYPKRAEMDSRKTTEDHDQRRRQTMIESRSIQKVPRRQLRIRCRKEKRIHIQLQLKLRFSCCSRIKKDLRWHLCWPPLMWSHLGHP